MTPRSAALFLGLASLFAGARQAAFAQVACNSVTALQILQHGTVEGQGFNATLTITNSGNAPLSNVSVTLRYTDPNQSSANGLFFAKVNSLQSIVAIDGSASAIINANSTAQISWLIVPANGAGGTVAGGINYNVAAEVRYSAGGSGSVQDTPPATINVQPQPNLQIVYSIPSHVAGGVSFPMAIRITNVGAGTAKNLQINGGNPQILSSVGTPVNFQVVDAKVNGITTQGSLLLNFGDLAPQGVAVGEWDMVASASGTFASFNASFTNSPDLGGTLTSPVSSVNTYTLVQPVATQPPANNQPSDILVDTNGDGIPDTIVAANGTNLGVALKSGSATGSVGPGSPTFTALDPPATGWAITEVVNPPGNGALPVQVIRSDGKVINPKNYWLRNGKLDILDFQPAGSYAVTLNPVAFDVTPPKTVFQPGAPSFSTSPYVLAPYSILGFQATDDLSGVATTQYRIDGSSFALFSAAQPFVIAQPGSHTIDFFSTDFAGNVESTNTVSVFVDSTTPLVAISTPSAGGVVSGTAPVFGLATALHFADYQLSISSGSAFVAIAASTQPVNGLLGLWDTTRFSTGTHVIQLTAGDVLGRVSTATVSVAIAPLDSLPPRTALNVGSPKYVAGQVFISSATPLTLSAVDDKSVVGDGVGVGVAKTLYAVDGASFTAYSGTFTLVAQGTHTISFYSVDLVGNAEVVRSSAVAVDVAAPVTTLAFAGGRQYAVPGAVYASSDTSFAFAAVDPVSSGVASGVALTRFRDGTGAFQAYASSFTLAEGVHTLAFQSQDNVGNLELLEGATVFVDAAPPVTAVSIGSPTFTGADGTIYVGTTTPVAFAAVDAAIASSTVAGSGVNRIEVAVDTTAFTTYVSTLTFAEGRHVILYRAVDNVGNVEAAHTLALSADATPPSVAFRVLGSSFTDAAGNLDVSTATALGLLSTDPVVSSVASGVRLTQYQVNGGTFTVYAGTFTLAAPDGARLIAFQATDNVGNTAPLNTATVFLDATPPITTLAVGAPQYVSSGTLYVSTGTPFVLASQDPVVGGVASGVRAVSVATSSGSYAAYAGTFTLTAPDGGKTLSWFGTDNVGNAEVAKSSAVVLDATPPLTAVLMVGGTTYPAAGGVYVSSATRLILSAVDPLVNGVASGLAFTRWQDNGGAFSVYASSLALAEGGHAFAYQSQDNVANLEVLHSTGILVDATPPVTAVAVGASSFTSVSGVLYVTPATPVTLAAADPPLPQLSSGPAVPGSGVAQILVSVDSGAFTVYVASLTFAEGAHTLAYRSIDNVGNAEALRVLSLRSDATPPQTALAVSSPAYQGYVSSATIFSLAALDPASNGVASGVAATRYQINGGVFLSTPLAFGLTGPDGPYALRYQSVDNVGNAEIPRSTSVLLDQTPPQTTALLTSGTIYSAVSGVYVSSATRLVLVSSDPVVNGVASGLAWTRWQDNGAAFQVYASSLVFAEGSHTLGYQSQDNVANLEVLRSTTILVDATPPVTTVAIGSPTYTASDGTLYVATTTPIAFSAVDPALASSTVAGSGVNHIEVSVDSAPFTPYASALVFAEGPHVVLYRAIDNVGNIETTRLLALRADATPPASSLAIGSPQFALSSATVLVSSLTPIAVAAVDPLSNGVASGVRQSFYAVGGGSFAVFAASFTLTPPDGPQTISFYSQDNVLNTEAVKVGTVVLDATPPAVALLSPGGCSAGICRVLKGKFPVLGSATDLHFARYILDFAPGQSATTGYALVSSGTVAVSSAALGTWDASALTGWQTLRLTATDLVANASVVTVNVFVGDPGELMVLGNHDVFNMPQGVASDASGNVYVADTNADRVAVFSATGAFVTAYGQTHDDRDDHVSSTTVQLNKPKGVAVDAAGNIFIADTNENRVLKLSATGQILLSLGRQAKSDKDHDGFREFQSGKGLGEFNKPSGLALDAAGNIYVADTNNDRVQVLSSTGAPLLAFALPPLPKVHDDEKADHDDDQPTLGRPFGVAVDAAGRIYVTDPYGSRALVFGATGQLLLTLPISGTTKDGHVLPGRPEGVAVSTDGYCLLVSDRKFDRVLRFDAAGDPTLAFGAPGHYDARKPAAGIVFHKPVGLALASDGTLLVADRNNDRVERFGLPTGKTLVVPPSSNDDPNDLAQDVLDSDAGGTVARADNAGVTIPPGALPDDLKITVSTISAAAAALGGAMDEKASAKGLAPAYAPVQYGPEGTQFNTPVTLVEPYDPNLVATSGMSEDSLAIHYWNPAKNDWEALASTVDKSAHTVTAKTPHFSLYQVLGSTGTGALRPLASADPTFTFHAGYAFPNPVRGTSVVTIRIQPGLADSVSVNVYDISGRRVHSSSDFKQNILDDGNGLGFQYTFDHVWDISGVGSGVYMYVITAHKGGMSDIHKSGKIGLIK